MKRYEKRCHVLEKPFYKIQELYEEWEGNLSISDLDLEDVFNNKINYGIYLDTFLTIALVKTSDQYIPVACCVLNGVVASNQPVINTGGASLRYWEALAYHPTKKIERIQFLPSVTKISNWDESKPTIIETESFKTNQLIKFPSFDELHKKGSLRPEIH